MSPPTVEQQQSGQNVHVIVERSPRKSALVAFLLTFFFGPFGMLYTTVPGAIFMLLVSVVVAIFTLGYGLAVTHPICIIWACIAASKR